MKTLITAVLLCLSTVANAEVVSYITAKELIDMLKSPKIVDKANATGYALGVFDATYGQAHCTNKIHPTNMLEALLKSEETFTQDKLKEINASDFVLAVIIVNGKACNLI